MKQKPLISVLVPIHNSADYLLNCVESILRQSYKNIEIILMDDNSSDQSSQICKSLKNRDSRIVTYRVDGSGVALARQQLLDKARGEFVIFVDSDDWIDPEMIEFLYKNLVKYNVDIVSSKVSVPNNNECSEADSLMLCKENAIESFLNHEIPNSLCVKLVKMELYRQTTFPKDILFGEDMYMTWQLLNITDKIVLINKSFYHYSNNPLSITHQKFSIDTFSLIKACRLIRLDCQMTFPELLEEALSNEINNAIFLLYYAAKSGYPKDEHIAFLINIIVSNRQILNMICKNNIKKLLFVFVVSRSYNLCKSLLS